MKTDRERHLERLVSELLYLVNEVTLPRCEFYRRAAETTREAEQLLIEKEEKG